MGLWEVIIVVVVVATLGSVVEKYLKLQSNRAGQMTTSELRKMIQEAVREEVEPLHEDLRRLESKDRERRQLEAGERE